MTSEPKDASVSSSLDMNAGDSTVEAEDTGSQDQITDPFDPEDIKIRTRPLLVGQLVRRIQDGSLDLSPDFQRLRGIWDARRRSRLIESLLLRIPIPVFYVAANSQDDWQVVDGLQRMSTIHDYVAGNFALTHLEYLAQFNGKFHDKLPGLMRRRIDETELIVNVIEPSTPPEVMFNVFVRINTLGMTLNSQELRHALHPGPVRDLLTDFTTSDEFLAATDRSISPRRMADKECVLRFIAFYLNDPLKYNAHDLDTFLSSAMVKVNQMTSGDRCNLASDFRSAMSTAYSIFGNEAFRKKYFRNETRRPINRSLFEAWSVSLARLSSFETAKLIGQRETVQRKFLTLMNNDEFNRSISYATGTRRNVHKRFRSIEELVREVI